MLKMLKLLLTVDFEEMQWYLAINYGPVTNDGLPQCVIIGETQLVQELLV